MKEDCSKALVHGRWLNEGLCSGSWNNPEMRRRTLRFHGLEKPAETWRFLLVQVAFLSSSWGFFHSSELTSIIPCPIVSVWTLMIPDFALSVFCRLLKSFGLQRWRKASSTSQKGHHPPPLDEQVVLMSPLCFRVVCIKRRACQPTPVFLPGESPWTEEPAGLQSTGLQRVGHDRETKHSRAQCENKQ